MKHMNKYMYTVSEMWLKCDKVFQADLNETKGASYATSDALDEMLVLYLKFVM